MPGGMPGVEGRFSCGGIEPADKHTSLTTLFGRDHLVKRQGVQLFGAQQRPYRLITEAGKTC